MNIKLENYNFTNILDYMKRIMSKESEKELKKLDHEEMKEESHQLNSKKIMSKMKNITNQKIKEMLR